MNSKDIADVIYSNSKLVQIGLNDVCLQTEGVKEVGKVLQSLLKFLVTTSKKKLLKI